MDIWSQNGFGCCCCRFVWIFRWTVFFRFIIIPEGKWCKYYEKNISIVFDGHVRIFNQFSVFGQIWPSRTRSPIIHSLNSQTVLHNKNKGIPIAENRHCQLIVFLSNTEGWDSPFRPIIFFLISFWNLLLAGMWLHFGFGSNQQKEIYANGYKPGHNII